MVDNPKNAFWQAFIFSIFVFGIGLVLGFFLEGARQDKVQIDVMNSEINVLDEQIRNKMIEEGNIECLPAIISTFDFADRVYNEAVKMEKYDSVSKFKSLLPIIHRRYDLLRMMVWSDASILRSRCNSTEFHTVVYLFEYDSQDVELKAKQSAMSKSLMDLKNNNNNKVLLIPIAANLDLESVNTVMEHYGIDRAPAIIIDDNAIIMDIIPYEELENIVFKSHNT